MEISRILIFVSACLVFGFIPGPALLQTVTLTVQHGYRAGLRSALGIHVGAFIQIILAAIGVAVIFAAEPQLYHAVRVGSGSYLMWLGYRRIVVSRRSSQADPGIPDKIFLSSVLIEATNPKSAIFYLSFLSQFISPAVSANVGWQFLALGLGANVIFSVADVLCILLSNPLRQWLRPGGRSMVAANFLAGVLFIAFGLTAIFE